MAATARACMICRSADLPIKPLQPPPLSFTYHLLIRPLLPAVGTDRRPSPVVSCIVSGVDGGGVSDDFVTDMLKKIEPLDTSVILKGVSDSANDSMKQTISMMLGLVPSDQFSVTVRVSKRPLDDLFTSINM